MCLGPGDKSFLGWLSTLRQLPAILEDRCSSAFSRQKQKQKKKKQKKQKKNSVA
jgi:hypothetical protein